MKLSELAADLQLPLGFEDAEVTAVTDSSEKIIKGCVFVCIRGKHFDGHTKAAQALEKGAACVIVSEDLGLKRQILVKNARSTYSLLCAAFYNHPEKKLKLIGITGTNGKTTTAFIIHSALEKMGHKTAMIGTVKIIIGDTVLPSSLTTPDPYDLFRLLSQAVDAGCEYCVMEVSSQALDQRRVEGLYFTAAVFTNLTQDHLDYHGTFENYMAAKHKLFENAGFGVFNIDDKAGEYMMSNTHCRCVTYSVRENKCDYSAKVVRISASGVIYEIVSNTNIGRVTFRVPGEFSIYNSMGAIVCLLELGMDFRETVETVSMFNGVPGRMEIVPTDTQYTVIIDYAHTPDGLENVITTLKNVTEGRVIAVYGCGGDRDKAKRPIMGDIGSKLADISVITSDNPRSENPQSIIDDIIAGVDKHNKSKVIVECDRTKAIAKALSLAQPNDVVLLAGKGHEDYQILADGKIHYDEREVVANLLK